MKGALNLHKVIEAKHERKWVALSKDKTKVVAFDESLLSLKKKIGDQKVVYMKVPSSDMYLSF